jgi:hypothetical protein
MQEWTHQENTPPTPVDLGRLELLWPPESL